VISLYATDDGLTLFAIVRKQYGGRWHDEIKDVTPPAVEAFFVEKPKKKRGKDETAENRN
jgi:hypothetical protein